MAGKFLSHQILVLLGLPKTHLATLVLMQLPLVAMEIFL
jgi:hypothetical protein